MFLCRTRYKPWPKVSEFMSSLPPYSLVADVGCGNGRYLKCCHPTATIIALDRSPPLVQLADAANPCQGCTFVGDAVQVSFALLKFIPSTESACCQDQISISVLRRFLSGPESLMQPYPSLFCTTSRPLKGGYAFKPTSPCHQPALLIDNHDTILLSSNRSFRSLP